MKINKQEIARCQICGTMQAVRDGNAIIEMDSYTLCCEKPEYFIKDSLWDEYGVTKLLHDSVIVSINPRNSKWKCSACDVLCSLLTSSNAAPIEYVCPIDSNLDAKWRKIS